MRTEYYTVKEGIATPIANLDIGAGRTSPTGADLVELPSRHWWESKRKIAVYPVNSPTPFPLGSPHTISPKAFGVADLQNLLGPYISSLVKRALVLQETEALKMRDWVMIGLAGLSLVISCIGLYLLVQIARYIEVI